MLVIQSCQTLCDPPWKSPGKSSGVGSHFLFQGILLTQGLNPGVPHCRQIPYHLSHQVQVLQNKLWSQKLIKWNLPSSKEKIPLTSKSNITQKKSEVTQSCPTLCNPMDCIACQAPPSMGFSRQGYWIGLPFPPPGDLPDPGTEPGSPALLVDSLPSEPQGSLISHKCCIKSFTSMRKEYRYFLTWKSWKIYFPHTQF